MKAMTGIAPAADVRRTEDLIREIFAVSDRFDVLVFQAEAIALLEASARALAGPGTEAGVLVTSVYGQDFDTWFRASGASSVAVDCRAGDGVARVADARRLFARAPQTSAFAVVQGEALTGVVNAVDEMTQVATDHGAVTLVDAVSSVGSEPFTPSRWGVGVSVLGLQKALEGPAGLSFAVIDRGVWDRVEANPAAPRQSFLSLLDLKHAWIDGGRAAWPGTPNSDDIALALVALEAVASRGVATVEAAHQQAKHVARAAVEVIDGLSLPVAASDASGISTLVDVDPALGASASFLARLAEAGVTTVKAAPAEGTVRWMHYGPDSAVDRVEAVADAVRRVVG